MSVKPESEASRPDPSMSRAQPNVSAPETGRLERGASPGQGRRRTAIAPIAAVIALELFVPLVLGLVLLVAWVWVWTPSDGFWAGRARVRVTDRALPAEDVAAAQVIVPSSTSLQPVSASLDWFPQGTTPPPSESGVKRFRLGDVVPVDDRWAAVIYDENLRITADEPGEPARPAPAGAASVSLVAPAYAGMAGEQQQQQLNAPNPEGAAAEKNPYNTVVRQRPQGNGQVGLAVHPKVTLSAAVNALLAAEYGGVSTVIFLPHRRIADQYYDAPLTSLGEGIAKLADHLHSVRRVYLPLPDEADLWASNRDLAANRLAELIEPGRAASLASGVWAHLRTPLAWPGG